MLVGQSPTWHVLTKDRTRIPTWWTTSKRVQWRDKTWWSGLLSNMYPLYREGCKLGVDVDRALKDGANLDQYPYPRLRATCITACMDVKDCNRWLKTSPFQLRTDGTRAQSRNSRNKGYLRVKAGELVPNSKAVYLHRLLCYMYHGPNPANKPRAGHLCEGKMCICPWHIEWMKQENIRRHHAHKRQSAYQGNNSE